MLLSVCLGLLVVSIIDYFIQVAEKKLGENENAPKDFRDFIATIDDRRDRKISVDTEVSEVCIFFRSSKYLNFVF